MDDDSDQDFTDLCSRLLKRVRKGAGGSGDEKRSAAKDEEPSRGNPPKRRKKGKDATKTEVKSKVNGRTQPVVCADVPQPVSDGTGTGKVKDVVIRRMQRFKRASPERLQHSETNKPTNTESDGHCPAPVEIQHTEDVSSDEALALQLQQELDREARAPANVDDGGLFFCQLCQKDLSSMSPSLRTQHINRCLDASESSSSSASHHSHPRPRVPDCPICGKSFKSEKSRSVHLKRCSADMGVKPNDLLQALRRQAAETVTDDTSDQSRQVGGATRRDGVPVKKRTRRKAQKLDEDTMMALALSRSLLEQEIEKERELEGEREILAKLTSPPTTAWRPGAGKGRGKRRKGASPVQPPLLLIQDPQTALNRLQERVSSLLLPSRTPSPPTPTLSPSTLPFHPHGALWIKSALHGGGQDLLSEFYTSELSNFIQPRVAPEMEKLKSLERTPVKKPSSLTMESDLVQEKPLDQNPTHPQNTRPITPCSGTPGTQALQDLMELAEEGMTLTQYGNTTCTTTGDETDKPEPVNELPSSGFVLETKDKKNTNTPSVYVSKLTSDLSSMVNNPQLSDVQLQVDSGDVFFTHSFMLYTRCPLLANMVHESAFEVQEEGLPVARRVLLGDVLGEAVLSVLQYLYTGHCLLSYTLIPHIQELADRFGLAELQQQCEEYSGSAEENPRDESKSMFPTVAPHLREQKDQNLAESNFLELLQSMWQHEDSEEEDEFTETGEEERDMEEGERGDGEKEDQVDEEELDEIYEFAATQRKMETMFETATETEEEEGDENVSLGKEKMKDEETENNETESLLEKSAGSCHSNKQGVDGTEAAMVTSPTETLKIPNPETERVCLIPELDAVTNENKDPDACLDTSYDRLFSQSVGEYMEPSQTATSCSQKQLFKPSHTIQRAAFRPSCVSEVIDLSISPPSSPCLSGVTSFPMAGVSPVTNNEDALKSTSRKETSSCQGIENSCSAPKSPSKKVELIVLSDDSAEEMDVDGDNNAATTNCVLTPQSPFRSPSVPTCMPTGNDCKVNNLENSLKESGTQGHVGKKVNASTNDTEAKFDQSENISPGLANESVFDGSAEVSWLIPATPVPSTRCISAQTCISMRRTQLFPKSSSASSPSSSSSSVSDTSKPVSFASSSSKCLKKKLVLSSSLLKSDQSSSKEHPCTETDRSPGYQRAIHHLRMSEVASNVSHTDTIMGRQTKGIPQPSSSTPLHSDTCLQRQIPFGSPMVGELGLRDSTSYSRSFGNQGKVVLMSLQISSSSPSKTPEKKENSSVQYGCSSPSQNSASCSHPERSREGENDGLEKMEVGDDNPNESIEELVDIAGNSFSDMDKPGRKVDGINSSESVEKVVDLAGNSFCDLDKPERRLEEENPNQSVEGVVDINSFCDMDEPPIAFDDSWGLDGGIISQKPHFSLRLESSGGTISPPGLEDKGKMTSLHTSPLAAGAHNKTPDTSPGPLNHSLPDPDMWDDWGEEEDTPLPLSQRIAAPSVKRVAELRTPVACRMKNKEPLVPITPMPGFSDMDTPELKNRLNRFGVRPLPKKQMVLKLKEIHQYTHQLQSSDSEEEASGPLRPPKASNSQSALLSFKQPTAPPAVSPLKLPSEEDEVLSASQNSNTSSTAESERSNPEMCVSEDEDSDTEGITASQAVVREKDKLLAVRQFILSDPKLYGQVLRYEPLSLAELRSSLKTAGIRLGAAKLLDFLDSQCITFSTAKQGQNSSSRRKRRVKTTTNNGAAGRGRKKTAKPSGGVA